MTPLCLPVEVRAVPGYPSLRVSADGDVYGPRGRRRAKPDSEGYQSVSVRQPGSRWPQPVRVHRAVLLAWVGPSPAGMEGRHIDGDKRNCRLDNLTWSTHLANIRDKRRHGTLRDGEANHAAKLTDEAVRDIRRLWGSVATAKLAARYGVSKQTVWNIATRRAWKHVS